MLVKVIDIIPTVTVCLNTCLFYEGIACNILLQINSSVFIKNDIRSDYLLIIKEFIGIEQSRVIKNKDISLFSKQIMNIWTFNIILLPIRILFQVV